MKVGIKAIPLSYPNPGYGPVEMYQETGECGNRCDLGSMQGTRATPREDNARDFNSPLT